MNELNKMVENILHECGKTYRDTSEYAKTNIRILLAQYAITCYIDSNLQEMNSKFLEEMENEQV